MAFRYFVRDGKVICEDTPNRRETIAGNGDTRTVGNVTLTVRTGAGKAVQPPTRGLPFPGHPESPP